HLSAAPSITGQVQSAAPTRASNAEYIVSEIRRHKRSFAGVAIAAVVVIGLVIAYLAFWRTRTVLTDKDTILLADFVNTTTDPFEVDGREQVLKSLGPAAARLREKLGESLNTIKTFDAPIEQVTTFSLEALQQYSLCVEQHSKTDYPRAIAYYKKAIQLDPNFAMAHARLALCYNSNRQFEAARAEYKQAYDLRDRVS